MVSKSKNKCQDQQNFTHFTLTVRRKSSNILGHYEVRCLQMMNGLSSRSSRPHTGRNDWRSSREGRARNTSKASSPWPWHTALGSRTLIRSQCSATTIAECPTVRTPKRSRSASASWRISRSTCCETISAFAQTRRRSPAPWSCSSIARDAASSKAHFQRSSSYPRSPGHAPGRFAFQDSLHDFSIYLQNRYAQHAVALYYPHVLPFRHLHRRRSCRFCA